MKVNAIVWNWQAEVSFMHKSGWSILIGQLDRTSGYERVTICARILTKTRDSRAYLRVTTANKWPSFIVVGHAVGRCGWLWDVWCFSNSYRRKSKCKLWVQHICVVYKWPIILESSPKVCLYIDLRHTRHYACCRCCITSREFDERSKHLLRSIGVTFAIV